MLVNFEVDGLRSLGSLCRTIGSLVKTRFNKWGAHDRESSTTFVSLTLGLQAHQCYHSSLEICSRLMTTNDGFISIIINTLTCAMCSLYLKSLKVCSWLNGKKLI